MLNRRVFRGEYIEANVSDLWWLLNIVQLENIYMLFAGWEVRILKNCDRGLENAEAEVTVFHCTDRP